MRDRNGSGSETVYLTDTSRLRGPERMHLLQRAPVRSGTICSAP